MRACSPRRISSPLPFMRGPVRSIPVLRKTFPASGERSSHQQRLTERHPAAPVHSAPAAAPTCCPRLQARAGRRRPSLRRSRRRARRRCTTSPTSRWSLSLVGAAPQHGCVAGSVWRCLLFVRCRPRWHGLQSLRAAAKGNTGKAVAGRTDAPPHRPLLPPAAPHRGDLAVNVALGITLIWLPLSIAGE